MKQLVLTLGITLATTLSFAQKSNVTNAALAFKNFMENKADQKMDDAANDLNEAKGYIDKAQEHADTKDQPKTLMYKGKIYVELSFFSAMYQGDLFKDMDPENIAKEGFAALKKSKEVDQKGRYEDDVNSYVNRYRGVFWEQGLTAYDEQKYEMAMGFLLGAAEFGDVIGFKDSVMLFYGGLSAFNVGEYDVAEEALLECMNINYQAGTSAYYYSQACQKQDKVDQAEEKLKEMSVKHPDNKAILIEMINLYIDTDRHEQAEQTLTKAIELDPTNTALIYTSGNIYENMERFEDAEKAYLKTLEIEPDHVNAKFSLGGLYFNKGVDLNNTANEMALDDPNYQATVDESKAYFEKALPYLEAAAEAEPEDAVILESLKAVYHKLKMVDKFKETKAKIEALKG